MPELGSLSVDRRSAVPLRRQIYERLRDAIARDVLRPGDRLPSARALANQLGVARGTVDGAYAALAAEGYLVARGAAGTTVATGLRTALLHRPRAAASGNRRRSVEPRGLPRPFQLGLPALDAFPRKLWTRLATRQARGLSLAAMDYPDPAGDPLLREEILKYLAVGRGIECEPDQLLITSGFQAALGLISRALTQPGETVWVEDPGYFRARQALAAAGLTIVPVPVDDQGLDVDAGVARAPQARLALVTPSHQMPLGVSLRLPRRLELLEWARGADAWIVEDDYDSEYRYTGLPLPALKSLDRDGRVLYVGTFSKVLFPGLRLAYLVVPERLAPTFQQLCRDLHPDRPLWVEAVVAEFMRDGHFARHIRRMRALYARRRQALAEALREVFGGRFRLELQAGGMHLLARLDPEEDDMALVRAARARGLAPEALSRTAVEQPLLRGLLLGFTNIPADRALEHVERLADAIGAAAATVDPAAPRRRISCSSAGARSGRGARPR
ncbi:MAG TPA: PLP-dependent aminotransferase family protein [Pseudomonadales bacterium]